VGQQPVVSWDGAAAKPVTDGMAWADCTINTPAEHIITLLVEDAAGNKYRDSCRFTGVATKAGRVAMPQVTPSTDELSLGESSSNADIMSYFFGGTIAQLGLHVSQLEKAGRVGTFAPTRFGTTVGRSIDFEVTTVPPGFEPLMEVRPQGWIPYLGSSPRTQFEPTEAQAGVPFLVGSYRPRLDELGKQSFEVGPPLRSRTITIETYKASITSHRSGIDVIEQGVPITFDAVTDPPGYEHNITWLSSTKFGTAKPVLGRGPTFTAQFDDTFGEAEDGGMFQWLGVKADNAVINQDQKCKNVFPATAGIVASEGACNAQIDIFGVTNGFVDIDIPHANVCIHRSAPTSQGGSPREVQLDVLIEVGSFEVPKVGEVQIIVESGSGTGSVVAQSSSCDFPADMTLQVAKSYMTPLGTFFGGLEVYEATGIEEFPPYGVTFLQTLGDVPLYDQKGAQVGLFRPLDLTPIGPIDPTEFPGGCPPP